MTTDDPDDTPTQFGMDDTMPSGEDRTRASQPADQPDDRTLPSLPAEDRTLPSQPAEERTQATPELDRTLPTQAAQGKAPPKPAPKPAAGEASRSGKPQQGQAKPPGQKPPAAEGTSVAPPREPRDVHGGLIGKTLGGCRVEKLLGKGAMGAVYKAVQIKLDRAVAVKVIRPEMMTDPRMLKRFEVEARTVGKFNSANVVMVHDVGFEHGVHYLVMEFVQGKNLREHVKLMGAGRLPVGDALPLIRQACAGLNEARRLGVVHRDIKPDNLMLTDQGVLKIADFGIAKPVEQDFSMTLTSELIGTPLYMSPEQCQGGADIDFRSDMYSLGATFFYLLTGEPPIRASSVYELIQTKTKLENLCLWKALPELAENNPLSRVIERMTANDRDDRYESYEELVNDLVLVQEGGTITIPAKKPKKPGGTRIAPAGRGKAGVLAAMAVVALAGGGGGYWWWQQQQQQPVVVNGGGGGASDEELLERGRKAIEQFRNRLRSSGPSSALREEIVGEPMPAKLTGDRERLLGEVDAATAIDERLGEIEKPELELPFDKIGPYFDAIAAAGKVDAAAGEAVRTWAAGRVVAARDENTLAADARSLLSSKFVEWSADRSKSGGDDESLAALRARLDVLEAGRLAVASLFPSQTGQLERALPIASLQKARSELAGKLPSDVDADVELALADARTQLREVGPLPSVQDKVDKLRTTREDLVKARQQLLNDIGFADDRKKAAMLIRVPEQPAAPFGDVKRCYAAIDQELSKLKDDAGELPPWASKLRDDLRKHPETQSRCVTVCKDLFARLEKMVEDKRPFADVEQGQKDLAAAIAGALELFPAAKPELDPLQLKVEEAMTTARVDQQQQLLLARIRSVTATLAGVRTLEDWQRKARAIDAELEQLRKDVGDDASGDVKTALRELEAACRPWREAVDLLDKVAGLFDDGRLKDCLNELAVGVNGSEGRDEIDEVSRVAQGCQDLFRDLDANLDVEAAQQQLRGLRRRVDGATWMPKAFGRKLLTWENGLKALRTETERMVPIPAGRVGSPSQDVPGFFLGATEVSCDEFGGFLNRLKIAAGAGDREAQFQAVEAKLAGTGMTPRFLADLLGRAAPSGSLPVDHVSYYDAAAYAAWHGMQLPTPAQWALAAFGDGNRHTYPWGDDYPPRNRDLLHTGDRPVGVEVGGLSWRQDGSVKLHHLAGNVAEWLRCDEQERRAPVAGGRSGDPALKLHAGGELEKVAKDDTGVRYVGFRVALEPRAFAPLEWPR